MQSLDKDRKVALLLEALKIELLSLQMFKIILANGPVIRFDFYLQEVLAWRLARLQDGAIDWVNIVLDHSEFVLEQSLIRPMVSPELWRVLNDKLSEAELGKLPGTELGKISKPTLLVRSQVQRPSRNPFRRLWYRGT